MSNTALLSITVIVIIALVATMIAFMIKGSGKNRKMRVVQNDPVVPKAEEVSASNQRRQEVPESDLNMNQQREYQAILAHNSEYTANVKRIRPVSKEDRGSGVLGALNQSCRGSLPSIRYNSNSGFSKDPVLGYRLQDGDLSAATYY